MAHYYSEDFAYLGGVLADFFARVPPDSWALRTGNREKDWTLRQTLAHLVSVAQLFNRAAHAAVHAQPFEQPGVTRREDLAAWNAAQIAAAEYTAPADLLRTLLEEFDTAARMLDSLIPDSAQQRVFLRIYNRPQRALDLLDFQLSHAGIIHAAQVTRPLALPPLWSGYPPDFTRRQIGRFLRQFSAAYWQDAAPADQYAPLNFVVSGSMGGTWHVVAAPDGGTAGEGAASDPTFTYHFADPAVMFALFTVELPFMTAVQSGLLKIDGDVGAALGALRLFSPARPAV